jgi:hypothetical protein
MQTPLTPGQKIIAYGSLVFILLWMLFNAIIIWMMFAES